MITVHVRKVSEGIIDSRDDKTVPFRSTMSKLKNYKTFKQVAGQGQFTDIGFFFSLKIKLVETTLSDSTLSQVRSSKGRINCRINYIEVCFTYGTKKS